MIEAYARGSIHGIRDFLTGRLGSDLTRVLVLLVKNDGVIGSLGFDEVCLGGDVISEIMVNIEVIRLDAEDDGDIWRGAGEVPELEAAEFIYYYIMFFYFVNSSDGGLADVAEEVDFG